MNTKKVITIVFGAMISFAALLPVARADESDQQTRLTFSQAVEIPGHVLPAGTYWFKILDSPSSTQVVQVFSADWKTVFATLITVNSERLETADETTVKFAERQSSGAPALLTWFYPGQTIGHEFRYPKQEERELAQDKTDTVVATPEVRMGF